MPKFRYEGTEPFRQGSGLVEHGSIVDLPHAPSKHFVPVRDFASRVPPPRPATKPTKEKEQ